LSFSKVYIIDILNDEGLKNALELDSNSIICNEVKINQSIPNGIKIINSEIYRIEGTWEIYNYIGQIVDKVCLQTPKQFISAGIKLQPAMCKLVYWSIHKLGALKVAFDKIDNPKIIVNDFQFIKASKTKEVLKYFKNFFLNNWRSLRAKNQSLTLNRSNISVGVLINDEFELSLYFETLQLIGKCIVFHYGNIDFTKFEIQNEEFEFINLSKLKTSNYQPFSNPFRKNAEELFVTNIVLKDWIHIANEIEYCKFIHLTGIKKLLINVGENLPLRNLMPQIFKSNIMVYNSMNGLKSGEAHDADINFDKWFVWDKFMRDLLHEKCNLPYSKLIVSGHLSQDLISNYNFKNSFNFDVENLKGKKIISLFSVRGHRKEKIDAFEVLYEFIEKNQDFFLLVKPHPLEKVKDYIMPKLGVKNVFFLPESVKNSKDALYDQLYLTDLSIVFGSTVALESKWMGVPCITYEYKEKSFVYNLESGDIEHIKDQNQLFLSLSKTSKKLNKSNQIHHKVCEIISSYLLTK
jgi:hypothetical protein